MKTLKIVIVYTLLVYGLALLASCSERQQYFRATVLENNTITQVAVSRLQADLYTTYDTVWVNLDTHTIDDSSDSAMQCVLGGIFVAN